MKKILLFLSLFTAFCTHSADLPFSDAVRVGNTLYLSGQTGSATQEGMPVPGGIKAQTKQTMDNIRTILQRYGLDMVDVKKCTIMLANIRDWEDMNSVYATYFPKEAYPARTAFGNSGLADGYLVQIDCIASFSNNG